ncbi:hypothetical protein CRYUN_Cryun27aG0075600 [Craigia yunnanensis]
MTMESSEQPLKKRRLYEPPPEPRIPLRSQRPPSLRRPLHLRCLRRKFSKEGETEMRFEVFTRTTRGLSLRLVADFVPRYASYCPTALEAATKVIINVHNASLAVISRGEDVDNVAFQTAKACSFGLADICSTASAEASTSLVIIGICLAVFQNVVSFFVLSIEGKNLFQIVGNDICKMQDSDEIFSELKQKISDEDESLSIKLSKFHALSLLRIFFSCPKNLLSACFELFRSSATEEADKGLYFLRQATGRLDNLDADSGLDKINIGPECCTGSLGASTKDCG